MEARHCFATIGDTCMERASPCRASEHVTERESGPALTSLRARLLTLHHPSARAGRGQKRRELELCTT